MLVHSAGIRPFPLKILYANGILILGDSGIQITYIGGKQKKSQ